MIVTLAKHMPDFMGQSPNTVIATIDGMEMQIPMDSANRHYAAILEWVSDGNTIEEAD